MISEKQLEANRANAQKSTGPRTEAGKQRSCLNAFRHGLTSQSMVMPEEDMEAYNNFTAGIVASLAVIGALEHQLAQSYATFQWRINRAAAIEETMYTLGLMEEVAENLNIEHPQAHNATSNAKTFRAEAAEFARLSLYSSRMVSQAEKVFKQLKTLQTERRNRDQAQMSEAIKIYQARKVQGETFDPKAIGFDFSLDTIKAILHRRCLADPNYSVEKAEQDRRKAV
jgi:hypothetical protein